jgi:hypothetical protein
MNIPMDVNAFENFVAENQLFIKTKKKMIQCLKNWYKKDKDQFLEDLWTDIDTVLSTYTFEKDGVSFSKSYSYEPPLEYISVWIKIFDNEGSYCAKYTAFYDLNLNCFDDKISV